eukprot:2507120-Rhodomonas_salina.1
MALAGEGVKYEDTYPGAARGPQTATLFQLEMVWKWSGNGENSFCCSRGRAVGGGSHKTAAHPESSARMPRIARLGCGPRLRSEL